MECGRRPHLPKICAQSDPPPSENADFDKFQLIVPQLWELARIAIIANRKSTSRFPSSHRWTLPYALPLSRSKGGSKREFLYLALPFYSSLQVIVDISNLIRRLNIASPSLQMTNRAWKGRGHVSGPFLIFSPPKISLERLKLETLNLVYMLIIASRSLRTTNCPWKGRGHGQVTSLVFGK